MHDVQFDPAYIDELAVIGHVLHRQQIAGHVDDFPHRQQRLGAFDANIRGQRIPPRANTEYDAVRREVVQRQVGRRDQGNVASPVVDHTGADFDLAGGRRECRHRHNGVTHESAFSLPDRLEAAILGVLDELDSILQGVCVLQVQRYAINHALTPVYTLLSLAHAHSVRVRSPVRDSTCESTCKSTIDSPVKRK